MRDARGRTTTAVGRGEKGCAMGAYTDPPSRHQADQILQELRELHRSFNDLKSNLGLAAIYVVSVGLYIGLLVLLANRG
jgi:uncharacterized protein (DUF4213/DUF364 family)